MSTTIYDYMQSVKDYRYSRRVKKRTKQSQTDNVQKKPALHKSPLGLFHCIPEEMLFRIFSFCHPSDLGSIALVSKVMQNVVVRFLHGKESLPVIIPFVPKAEELSSNLPDAECFVHFHNLGILLKRATCLFSTRERLKEVEAILDKLQDTHSEICATFGSDVAYSCYGMFLHSFVAGWEDDEKLKAYMAIKGASCLDEKLNEVLHTAPASQPWYERYVRVFCREIFLDKACDETERAFWLSSILKPWPYVFQARLLYILYGPLRENSGFIDWELMETSPTFYGVEDPDMKELAEALQILLKICEKEWGDDNLITVFDELTALPEGWCFENVAKLLKLSGEVVCHKVLSSKAASGKLHELAYLGYYVAQVTGQEDIIQGKGRRLERFIGLLKQVLTATPNYKDQLSLISALFNVWEENILSLSEDIHQNSADSPEEQEQAFLASLHNLTRVSILLMKECSSK